MKLRNLEFPDSIPLEYVNVYNAIGCKECVVQLIEKTGLKTSKIQYSGREFSVPSEWLGFKREFVIPADWVAFKVPADWVAKPNDFELLQNEVGKWADTIFPNRTAENALTKMVMEEIPEFIAGDLKDSTELADVGILLLDVAYLQNVNLFSAIKEKMKINRVRKWEKNKNTGLVSHVKGT
jgi:hypothetical protein